jgi:hypothetical protein
VFLQKGGLLQIFQRLLEAQWQISAISSKGIGNSVQETHTAGELKIDRSFNLSVSNPEYYKNLGLGLDLSGPQVVALENLVFYIKTGTSMIV